MTSSTITTFEVGRTYWTRSMCDYDCIYRFTILARTAKTVTVEVHGNTVRRGLSVVDGEECFRPFGNYSMAAIIRARGVEPKAETVALVEAHRSADGSYSSGGVGRFKSPVIAATVLENRMRLRDHVNAAGTDPEARKAALLSYFGVKGEA